MIKSIKCFLIAISSFLLFGCSGYYRGVENNPQGPYHKGDSISVKTYCSYHFFTGNIQYPDAWNTINPTVLSSTGLNISSFQKSGNNYSTSGRDALLQLNQTARVNINSVNNSADLLCSKDGVSQPCVDLGPFGRLCYDETTTVTFPVFEDLHLVSSSSSLLSGNEAFITASITPDAEFESNRPSTIVFSLPESQQYVDFVNNESSCVIAKNQTSCRVAVRAKDVTSPVSQLIRANGVKMFESSVILQISAVPVESMYIFVTNAAYDGNLGGFSGADTKCNADTMITQNPSKLGGGKVFKALLNGNNATISGATYKNINDQTIAVATGGNLVGENAAITNAMSSTSFSYAWTGMGSSSVIATNCSNWTSTSGTGTVGYSSAASQSWSVSSSGPTVSCSGANQTLYCVEQP